MQRAYLPAPTDKTLYFLALLRRALLAIKRHTSNENVSSILFAGHLADALHNVPAIMWHWNESGWWKPSEIESWVVDGFPAYLIKYHAPRAWVEEATQISRFADSKTELDLSGFDNIVLAPPERYEYYLGVVYHLFLRARMVRGWQRRLFWNTSSLRWDASSNPQRVREPARETHIIASLLTDLPTSLVQWQAFDEATFLDRARNQLAAIPGEFERWAKWHEYDVNRREKEAADAVTN